jgi:mRNA interferase HigB
MIVPGNTRSIGLRVISQSRLKQFWAESHRTDAEGPLRAWYRHVSSKATAWHTWSDVKASFANASLVGSCTVFNIGGNKYRLITRILFPSQKVFVLKVLTHAEYDDDKWKKECGCFAPAPQSKPKSDRRS